MKTRAVTLILLGMVALSCLGSDETACIPCMQAASANSKLREKIAPEENSEDPVYHIETQEAMEWQCIVVDIVIEYVNCVTRICDYCIDLCLIGCNATCTGAVITYCVGQTAVGVPPPPQCFFWGAFCPKGCDWICEAYCPSCTYCDRVVTKIYSCGWVFTE